MSVLPCLSGRQAVAALAKLGYEKDRQKGSHIILRQNVAPHRRLTIPDYKKLATATLRAIINQAGLIVEVFNALMT